MNNYYDEEKNKQNWSKACTVALVADAAYALIASNSLENYTVGLAHGNEPENTYGYDDYSSLKVKQNNFMVLNIGADYDLIKMGNIAQKCNENDISCAVVLHSKANNLGEMYDEIDMLQAFCQRYTIDLPIYLSIDEIMNNYNLDNNQRTNLINAFITKCSNSNMYIGLAGGDANLYNCDTFITPITEYDTYLIMDHDFDKEEYNYYYKGTATLKKDRNGNITAGYNLADVINSKGLNKEENQVLSAYYTLQPGESIPGIALKYGLSVNDILNYNDIKASKMSEAKVIKIPNMYATVNKDTNTRNYSYAAARGIDISVNQDTMDWDRIKETSDFIIIRATSARNSNGKIEAAMISADKKLEENVIGAFQNQIPFGLYFAVDKQISIENFKARFESRLQNCDAIYEQNGITVDKDKIPLFIDFEYYAEDNDYYQLIIEAKTIANNYGYSTVGIYANRSTIKDINNNIKNQHGQELSNLETPLWLAGGPQYSKAERSSDGFSIEELEELNNDTFLGVSPALRQVTNVCKDTGAADGKGNCDVSYLYTDELFPIQESENPTLNSVILQLEKYESRLKHFGNQITSPLAAPMAIGVVLAFLKLKLEVARRNKETTQPSEPVPRRVPCRNKR